MYSKIEIFGGCDVNYLNVRNTVNNNSQMEEMINKGLFLPSWEVGTFMTANYQNKIDATPLSIEQEGAAVVGYQIQRYDVKDDVMHSVAQIENPRIQDYNVLSGKEYQYYIFPIIKIEGKKTLGSPLVTDSTTPVWEKCTIVGLIATEKENEYIVDSDNIWHLQLNVEQENYTLNTDKNFTDGFDRFPKRTQGIKKYISSGVNSILGTLDCASNKVNNTIYDIERWEEFCYSSNLKLFSDMRGRILPIDIKSVSTGYLTNITDDSPLVTSISFVQLDDANDISVYSLNETDGV